MGKVYDFATGALLYIAPDRPSGSDRDRCCRWCGDILPDEHGRPGPPRKYCDVYCRRQAAQERRRRG